jgi:hypothetical protein
MGVAQVVEWLTQQVWDQEFNLKYCKDKTKTKMNQQNKQKTTTKTQIGGLD